MSEQERLTEMRSHLARRQDLTQMQCQDLFLELKDKAQAYRQVFRHVDENTRLRERGPDMVYAHWNHVPPLDPRRWCEDCLSSRIHRTGCSLIDLDGPYVGGYPDDGTQPIHVERFVPLKAPSKHWRPQHYKQHHKAVARRWRAFCGMWMKIGLDYLTRVLTSSSKKARLPRSLPPVPRPTRVPRSHISEETLARIEQQERHESLQPK